MLGQLALNGKHGGSNINVLIPQGFGKSLRRVISVCFFHTSDLIFQKHCSLSSRTRPESTCLALIKSERGRSYIRRTVPGWLLR